MAAGVLPEEAGGAEEVGRGRDRGPSSRSASWAECSNAPSSPARTGKVTRRNDRQGRRPIRLSRLSRCNKTATAEKTTVHKVTSTGGLRNSSPDISTKYRSVETTPKRPPSYRPLTIHTTYRSYSTSPVIKTTPHTTVGKEQNNSPTELQTTHLIFKNPICPIDCTSHQRSVGEGPRTQIGHVPRRQRPAPGTIHGVKRILLRGFFDSSPEQKTRQAHLDSHVGIWPLPSSQRECHPNQPGVAASTSTPRVAGC